MPDIRITNPNTEGSAITVNVNLVSIVPVGEQGDHKYIFALGTGYKDKDNKDISPIYIHTTNINGFWESLPKAIESICNKIDWGISKADTTKPYINYYGPEGDNVSLFSSVVVNIKDDYPSAGIDTSSIKVYVNDIEVTNDLFIEGSYKDLKLTWNPKKRVLK